MEIELQKSDNLEGQVKEMRMDLKNFAEENQLLTKKIKTIKNVNELKMSLKKNEYVNKIKELNTEHQSYLKTINSNQSL